MPTEIEDLLMAMEAVRLAFHIISTLSFKSSNVFEHEPSVVRDGGGGGDGVHLFPSHHHHILAESC